MELTIHVFVNVDLQSAKVGNATFAVANLLSLELPTKAQKQHIDRINKAITLNTTYKINRVSNTKTIPFSSTQFICSSNPEESSFLETLSVSFEDSKNFVIKAELLGNIYTSFFSIVL